MLRCFIWVMARLRGDCQRCNSSARRDDSGLARWRRMRADGPQPRWRRGARRAEARAFYERIDALGLTPLWEVLGALVPPQPKSPVAPVALPLRRGASARAGSRPPDQRRGGRAARPRAREPGAARPVVHHAVALRRPAADPARRGRAGAPPHAVGAAPRPRRRGRLHRGRRRAHDDALRRLHHHAVVDLPRPRQRRPPIRSSGSTASTSRWCASSTPASPRRAESSRRPTTRPEGDALARYGYNMLPLDHAPTPPEPSRVFVYPFARTREALAGVARGRRRSRTSATSCASSTRRPGARRCRPSAPSRSACRRASRPGP